MVNEKKRGIKMPTNLNNASKAIKIFWIALCILLLISGWATSYGILKANVNNHGSRIEKLEDSYSDISKQLSGIQADLKWIKESLRKR